MQRSFPGSASWKALLASPSPGAHVVQVYDAQDFLAGAVAHFAAEGLQRGEAVLLWGARAHLDAIRGALERSDVDAGAALRSGQLALNDAHESLAAIAPEGRIDAARYDSLAGGVLERARDDGRFRGVRWWGEMSGLLYERGDRENALAAERCADRLNSKHGAALFCSVRGDAFDARAYGGLLHDMCCAHTHLIPSEDYVGHRLAVNRAIGEVLGEIRGPLLQSMKSWKAPDCRLPSSQALLFWLQEALPDRFEEVLARARGSQASATKGAHRSAAL